MKLHQAKAMIYDRRRWPAKYKGKPEWEFYKVGREFMYGLVGSFTASQEMYKVKLTGMGILQGPFTCDDIMNM